MSRPKSIEEFLAKHPAMKQVVADAPFPEKRAERHEPKEIKRETGKVKKPRKKLEDLPPLHVPAANFQYRAEKSEKGERRLVEITLPFPPPTNNLFYTQGRLRYKSYRYKQYTEVVSGSKKVRGILEDIPKIILKGNLHIKMKMFRPRLSGDWDGYIKAPQDILKGQFFDDDDQIVKGIIEKLLDRDNPRVEIVIYEVDFPLDFQLK